MILFANKKLNLDNKMINKIWPPSSGAIGRRLKIKRKRFSSAKKYSLSFLETLEIAKNKIKVKKFKIGPAIRTFKSSKKDVKDLFWSIMFNLKRLKSISILLAFVVFFSIIKCPNSCIIDASNAEITKKLLFIKNKSVIKNIKEKSICIL